MKHLIEVYGEIVNVLSFHNNMRNQQTENHSVYYTKEQFFTILRNDKTNTCSYSSYRLFSFLIKPIFLYTINKELKIIEVFYA